MDSGWVCVCIGVYVSTIFVDLVGGKTDRFMWLTILYPNLLV